MDAVGAFERNAKRFHARGGAAGNRRSRGSASGAEPGGDCAVSRSVYYSIGSRFRYIFRYIGGPKFRNPCATHRAGNRFSHRGTHSECGQHAGSPE